MTESILTLSDVHLTLQSAAGPVNILKGLNLDVPGGATVSVVGPSGSGKTTMLMVMAGLEKPSRGSVRVAGQELTDLNEDELARFRRGHIGIVFQAFHLVPTMTAVENVALPLEFAGRTDAWDQAVHALAAVGLGHRIKHYPAQLSGGEQQRVAIARAFAVEPKLLLADEPTGNLDGDTEQKVMDLLFTLQSEKKTTLILVTHDKELAGRCHMRLRMEDGRIEVS